MKKTFYIMLWGVIALVSLPAFARPLIIDTDVGTEDTIAMLYVLNHAHINIRAITIAATGEAHCLAGLRNVRGLLSLVNHTLIPVACGRDKPLSGAHAFPNKIRTATDQLSGAASSLPRLNSKASSTAIALLNTVLENTSYPIDILAIGPLTNIAEMITKYPGVKHNIHRIYIMGGAVHVPGNVNATDATIKNKVAEWNIYLDPTAADIVFRSGIPITLIPLDLTNQVPVTKAFYNKIKQNRSLSPLSQFIYALYHSNESSLFQHQWYFWDTLAAVIAMHNTDVTTQKEKLRVMLNPESQSGATIVDPIAGSEIDVGMKIKDIKQFKKTLLDKLH